MACSVPWTHDGESAHTTNGLTGLCIIAWHGELPHMPKLSLLQRQRYVQTIHALRACHHSKAHGMLPVCGQLSCGDRYMSIHAVPCSAPWAKCADPVRSSQRYLLKVDESSIARYIIVRPSPNFHSFCHKACLAERSKAPRSGRGSERSVGSNPTARTSFLGRGGTLFLRFFTGLS